MDRPLKLFSPTFECDKQPSSIKRRPETAFGPASIEINDAKGNLFQAPPSAEQKFPSFHEVLGPILTGFPPLSPPHPAISTPKSLFSRTAFRQHPHRGRIGSRRSQLKLQVVVPEDNLCNCVHPRGWTRSLPYGVEGICERIRSPCCR
jgi:hypothetical protein